MDIHGYRRDPRCPPGIPGNPYILGYPRISMDILGIPWYTLGSHGSQISMGTGDLKFGLNQDRYNDHNNDSYNAAGASLCAD